MIDQKKMIKAMILNKMEKYLTKMNEDLDDDTVEMYSCVICNLSCAYDNMEGNVNKNCH